MRGADPVLRNCGFPRAGTVPRSGIAEFYVRECSITQELRIPTRRISPSPRNSEFSRAGVLPRSGIADFHVRERSITQELQNPTRWNGPSPRNCEFPRAGVVHRSGIANSHARDCRFALKPRYFTRRNFYFMRKALEKSLKHFYKEENVRNIFTIVDNTKKQR